VNSLLILFALLVGAAQPAPAEREGYLAGDDGTRLFYRIEGAGPQTLVVVHGGPANSMESIRLDMEPLARGRRVIYYDQRGNGRSQLVESDEGLALERHIADLEALRRHFGLERLTLLGNSWGGLLISAYAAAHPDRIERLVLDSPAPPTQAQLEALGEEFARRARVRFTPEQRERIARDVQAEIWLAADDPVRICREVMTSFLILYQHDPGAELPLRGDVCSGPPEAVRRQRAVNAAIYRSMPDFDLRPAVRRVTAPVLVVYGESDAIPREGAEDWAANFGDARLLVIPGAGHLVHGEQPGLFFPAVEAFLAGRWPEGAVRVR
jgi:proline iminopeptidase